MRSAGKFIRDLATRPPLIMALIAAAHILWLAWAVWGNRDVPVWTKDWIQVAWMLGYTICWLAACDLRRWGALGYMALTATNIAVFFLAKTTSDKVFYTSNLIILDALFSFLLLIYYKRFGKR